MFPARLMASARSRRHARPRMARRRRELNAIFGWTDPTMAAHYTRTADRKRLAARGNGEVERQRNIYSRTFASGAGDRSKTRNEINPDF